MYDLKACHSVFLIGISFIEIVSISRASLADGKYKFTLLIKLNRLVITTTLGLARFKTKPSFLATLCTSPELIVF